GKSDPPPPPVQRNNDESVVGERKSLLTAMRAHTNKSPARPATPARGNAPEPPGLSSFPPLAPSSSFSDRESRLLRMREEISSMYSPYKTPTVLSVAHESAADLFSLDGGVAMQPDTDVESSRVGSESDDDDEREEDDAEQSLLSSSTPTAQYEQQYGTINPLPEVGSPDLDLAAYDKNTSSGWNETASDTDGDLDARLFGRNRPNMCRQMVGYVKVLTKLPVYVCLIFALSCCYFVVTGV
ncbi:hypothetical protein TeGR_g7597, partial [Tetraparma gracilis]